MGRFEREVTRVTSVPNLDDRLDDARHRLMLFVDMTAVALALQSANAPLGREAAARGETSVMLHFDDIVNALPEVEAYAVPSEQACVAILGSLEETCFPMFHRLVLDAASSLEAEEHDAHYLAPVGLKDTCRVKEDPKECAARLLFEAVIDRIKR